MEGLEPYLVTALTSHPLLQEVDVRAAYAWWLADRIPNESFVSFLIRHNILIPECVKTLELLRKGAITYCDPKRIYGEFGHQKMRDTTNRLGFQDPTRSGVVPAAGSRLENVKDWLQQRAEAKRGRGSSHEVVVPPPPPPPATSRAPTAPPPSGVLRRPAAPEPPPPAPDAVSQPPVAGEQLGKYLLTEQIGHGGTAIVFRAIHRGLNMPVAIKVLKVEDQDVISAAATDQSGFFLQLKREAQLLAKFSHSNIVRVYDFEENHAYPFLVLEYVDGLALSEVLAHCGRIRPDKAAKIVIHVADGLAAAQRKIGLVHRDIKPGNILLSKEGGIKLADLGLALVGAGGAKQNDSASMILAGTVAYMSPEQAMASPGVDHRADIYSLGATFYHAVCGEMPFRGRTRMELMFKHQKEPLVPPHHIVPGLPSAYSDVIGRMMAKDPKDRFQTYEELIGALSLLQSQSEASISLQSTGHSAVATI